MEFEGDTFVLERGIRADLALVRAETADTEGNLVYRKTARNFNPMMAMSGRVTVAEVERIVPAGTLDPDHIHTSGIFVQRIVKSSQAKRIEFTTNRERETA
jgi:3-oxoacid CoA-transferase subunit A